MYIVIEGQDSTGKSTQAELLAEYLRSKGKEVEIVEEPGGNLPVAQEIRLILKNKSNNLDPYTNVMLFMAARRELWTKRIEPVLKRGGVVISTRNWWSTLAYQGYGQGIDLKLICWTTKKFMPHKYYLPRKSIIFVLPEEERLRRMKGRDYDSSKDAFESQPDEFQQRVSDGYLKIAEMFNIETYDASPSIDKIQADLRNFFKIK
jgi:dTMP kinase